MLGVLFTVPDATTSLASISEWSSPLFTEFWPYAMIAIGIFLGIWGVKFVVSLFTHHDK